MKLRHPNGCLVYWLCIPIAVAGEGVACAQHGQIPQGGIMHISGVSATASRGFAFKTHPQVVSAF